MKRFVILTLCLLLVLSAAGCAADTGRVQYVGADRAKNIAAEAAGFTTAQVSFTDTDLDNRNGVDYYLVKFTAGGQNYEYDVDAISGTVIEFRQSAAEAAVPAVEPIAPAPAETPATDMISLEQAQAAALEHAGLSMEEVSFVKSRLDRDDGRQVYELEFYTADFTEYDYDIDPYSAQVLKFDYDAELYDAKPQPDSSGISPEEAKAIALAQVPGAAETDIRGFETDYDDGRLEYEGKIVYDGMEYEFEIDGYSGAIRNWEAERKFFG